MTHWSAQVSGTDQSPYPKHFSSKKEEEHREACLWDLVFSVWHDTPSQLSMSIWSYSHPKEHPTPATVISREKRSLQSLRPVWMVINKKKTFSKSEITETASLLWNPRACLSLGFRFKRLPHTNLSFFYPWAFKCHNGMDSVTAQSSPSDNSDSCYPHQLQELVPWTGLGDIIRVWFSQCVKALK